jgi:hypothetical protein
VIGALLLKIGLVESAHARKMREPVIHDEIRADAIDEPRHRMPDAGNFANGSAEAEERRVVHAVDVAKIRCGARTLFQELETFA